MSKYIDGMANSVDPDQNAFWKGRFLKIVPNMGMRMATILVMLPGPFKQMFVPSAPGGFS